MKLLQKQHKGLKIKQIFDSNLILIFHHNGFTVNEQNQLKKQIDKYNLKSYISNQTIAKKALNETPFKNIALILDGPVMLIYGDFQGSFNDFSTLCKKIHKNLTFIGLKKENTLYDKDQILNILKNGKGFHFNADKDLNIGGFRALSHIVKRSNIDLIKILELRTKENI